MKAWQIDDTTAYRYIRAVQKAIITYFEKRNDELTKKYDELKDMNDTISITAICENTHARRAIVDILYGDVDIDETVRNTIGDYIRNDIDMCTSLKQED